MDGLYVNGRRPASKKEVKAAIANNPASVAIESTSYFAGTAMLAAHCGELAIGRKVTFVGPDPYTSRKFYGTITRVSADKWKVE